MDAALEAALTVSSAKDTLLSSMLASSASKDAVLAEKQALIESLLDRLAIAEAKAAAPVAAFVAAAGGDVKKPKRRIVIIEDESEADATISFLRDDLARAERACEPIDVAAGVAAFVAGVSSAAAAIAAAPLAAGGSSSTTSPTRAQPKRKVRVVLNLSHEGIADEECATSGEFIVEDVLGAGYLEDGRLAVLLKWEGYDEQTWEPAKDVYDCTRVRAFVRDNQLPLVEGGVFNGPAVPSAPKREPTLSQCNICVSNGVNCVLTCGHAFCADCVSKLSKKLCPNCNTVIKGVKKLFL